MLPLDLPCSPPSPAPTSVPTSRRGSRQARRRRAGVATALALGIALVATGCTGGDAASGGGTSGGGTGTAAAAATPLDELDVPADLRTLEGPSTAVLASDEVVPLVEPGVASLPVEVTSHDLTGDTAQVVTDTSRLLALDISGALAATVTGLGLGDLLVGRDVSTTFASAADLPVVTKEGHSINAEAVLSLEPTLVITDGSIGPTDVVQQLRQSGVTVVYVENEPSPAGAGDLARAVGAALGVPAAGEALADAVGTRTEEVQAQIVGLAPAAEADRLRIAFLYLRGSAGIYYLLGEGTGADALVDGLGGVDVAAEIGWVGARPMTDEALVAADPDVFLVMTGGLESAGGVDGLLAAKPAVALTAAGEHRRFVDMADGQVLSFGPRTPEVLAALARAVYAPGQ
ncbi:hemin ABC transporter substrate-binding protein [Frigoribacterium sp. VKM Ac-2530]|uniref:heme/hemin ABC transporter substrate-binding protein n=1 Tax=Frigoribacterium sp. VKM Ac-2530 TaxID=2783822 RepID=UPI00188D53BD|nr:ABC transporter substrate-binding protein [Frigoribacterium sp. VKM Ac-2530]MBF4579437.1 ABC transporter substrate-binding protein [Frigoribacterium sp. VKM Ac-2530]